MKLTELIAYIEHSNLPCWLSYKQAQTVVKLLADPDNKLTLHQLCYKHGNKL